MKEASYYSNPSKFQKFIFDFDHIFATNVIFSQVVPLEGKKLIYLCTYGYGKLYRAANSFLVGTRQPIFSDSKSPFFIWTKVKQLLPILVRFLLITLHKHGPQWDDGCKKSCRITRFLVTLYLKMNMMRVYFDIFLDNLMQSHNKQGILRFQSKFLCPKTIKIVL